MISSLIVILMTWIHRGGASLMAAPPGLIGGLVGYRGEFTILILLAVAPSVIPGQSTIEIFVAVY